MAFNPFDAFGPTPPPALSLYEGADGHIQNGATNGHTQAEEHIDNGATDGHTQADTQSGPTNDGEGDGFNEILLATQQQRAEKLDTVATTLPKWRLSIVFAPGVCLKKCVDEVKNSKPLLVQTPANMTALHNKVDEVIKARRWIAGAKKFDFSAFRFKQGQEGEWEEVLGTELWEHVAGCDTQICVEVTVNHVRSTSSAQRANSVAEANAGGKVKKTLSVASYTSQLWEQLADSEVLGEYWSNIFSPVTATQLQCYHCNVVFTPTRQRDGHVEFATKLRAHVDVHARELAKTSLARGAAVQAAATLTRREVSCADLSATPLDVAGITLQEGKKLPVSKMEAQAAIAAMFDVANPVLPFEEALKLAQEENRPKHLVMLAADNPHSKAVRAKLERRVLAAEGTRAVAKRKRDREEENQADVRAKRSKRAKKPAAKAAAKPAAKPAAKAAAKPALREQGNLEKM